MAAKRVEGVHIEQAADEILALKAGSLEAHALNQSAAAVYELCDGKSSKAEMAAEIRRRTGLPADEEIVDLALAELTDAGLVMLEESEPQAAITRRSLIRRLALSSMAAMMLPVVETILVPPVEAAAPGTGPSPSPVPIPPVSAPVQAPVRPPVQAPVQPPVQPPVRPPTPTPTKK